MQMNGIDKISDGSMLYDIISENTMVVNYIKFKVN